MVFLLSLVVVTIPMGYVYNSISIIFFVLYSILAAHKSNYSARIALLLPVLLFLLMVISLFWSINFKESLKALGKESALIFIPVAFYLNRSLAKKSVNDVLKNYGICMCLFALYFVIRAIIRYAATGNIEVFFYHELATQKLNAIYLSVLLSLALFVFIDKKDKTFWGYGASLFLLVVIFLLSSKNIIIIDVLLIMCYYLFYSGLSRKTIMATVGVISIMVLGLGYYGKIYDRLQHEMVAPEQVDSSDGIHHVTIAEAWQRPKFAANYYFNGTAFRAYQIRIFTEMLREEPIFFTGYGINASEIKVINKGIEHSLDHKNGENESYNQLNFHNQYIEAFADLGIFGLVLVLAMALLNLINGIRHKYFIHIAFAVLMISLFLTESFLWRQRGVVFFTVFYCLFNDLRPFTSRTPVISSSSGQAI